MHMAGQARWPDRLVHRLREKGWRYWAISLAILLALTFGQPWIEARLNLKDARNALFMLLAQSVTNPSTPHNVKLVWIGDDEFWGDEMQGRAPTNRAYLAKLVRAIDAADASVIAIDFDLRLPRADAVVRPGDYGAVPAPHLAETDDLVRAIGEAATRRRVVLGRSVDGPEGGPSRLVPDTWTAYGLCTRLRPDGTWDNPGTPAFPLSPAAQAHITCAFIQLMDDKRQVPAPEPIVGTGAAILPFPLAIARARDPEAVTRIGHDRHYYASFVPEAALFAPAMSVRAGRLLAAPATAGEVLQGFPVIIGAAWHLRGPGQGEQVDVHDTPIGAVAGALIHANLAEAVLSGRVYPALSHGAMIAVEIVLGLLAALLFALVPSALLATAVLVATMPVLLLIQWLSLQLFGTFLDLFAPILGLGLHAIADRLINGAEA